MRAAEQQVHAAETEQAHRSHGESHDRTAEERHSQRLGCIAVRRRHRRAHVRARCGVHADPAGNRGRHRARDERHRRVPGTETDIQADCHQYCEYRQDAVLAAHENHRTAVDQLGDFRDLAFATGVAFHQCIDNEGGQQATDAEYRRYHFDIHVLPFPENVVYLMTCIGRFRCVAEIADPPDSAIRRAHFIPPVSGLGSTLRDFCPLS